MNKLSALLLFTLVTIAVASDDLSFPEYKKLYGVKFASQEDESFHQATYKANLAKIRANNADPKSTHKEGTNKLTHLTDA
jgi:hypothetical protein